MLWWWDPCVFCKESFVPLAANISGCILYAIRHSFLPLIPTGKSCAQLQHFCVRLQSCQQPVLMNLQAHGEIKARQERFRVQGVPYAMQSASPGRLLSFCCFSPCSLHSHVELSSPSTTDFPAFQLIFDIPGAIWGRKHRTAVGTHTSVSSPFSCFLPHLCFSLASAPGPSACVG